MTAPTLPRGPVMADVAGLVLTAEERQRLCHPAVGGVILFRRNYASREQITALVAQIKALRQPELVVAVDHEGGRVQRFIDGFTRLPAMRALGEVWDAHGQAAAQAQAEQVGWVLAAELRACGVDLSFTPVLDLDWGCCAVIGNRSFHADSHVVTDLALALQRGLQKGGMKACGKHFPGHGFVKADSHVDIPVDKRSLTAILDEDAAPYPWLSSVLTAVMPAHVIYPKVDKRPAGFSEKWLKDILRARLRYDGAIFSDDLSMEGARRIDGALISYTDAALTALNAGCDMVLLCNQSLGLGEHVDELLDGMDAALRDGRWVPDIDSESRRVSLLPDTEPQAWDDLMRQPAYLQALDLLP